MGAPSLIVNLPPAITIGVQVGVRLDPNSFYAGLVAVPFEFDTINGDNYFPLTNQGQCTTFIVGEVGAWWVMSDYIPATPPPD